MGQAQRQAQCERIVNQITTQTRQSLDLNTILTQAIAQLLEILEADRCIVHLVENLEAETTEDWERSQPDLHWAVLRRKHLYEVYRPPFLPSIDDFDTNGPITQWVIQHRQKVIIPDIKRDSRIGTINQEYRIAQIKSSLVVPVQTGETLQAILYLNQCSRIRRWSKDDQKLAQAVADQLAISIQQAHLYARTRQQAIKSEIQAKHLEETLHHLRQTQAQLIQSEKMSSLGQMVAGLAHEINNPISFIYGNIPYVESYLKDLIFLIRGYQARHPQLIRDCQDIAEEIDLDFLLQDVPRVLGSMKTGATRIQEIITTLRSFSSLDGAQRRVINLHEELDNVLSILHPQLIPDIEVVRCYGNLLEVECYPRLLSQVFMNLLVNAIEALHSPHMSVQDSQHTPKTITIRTSQLSDSITGDTWLRVAIADNGCGIPFKVQPKIFDPFFTTKDVGQGTGLGLAVSYYTVVNQHHGQLKFHSEPGKGAEFIVELPIEQPDSHLYRFSCRDTPTLSQTRWEPRRR